MKNIKFESGSGRDIIYSLAGHTTGMGDGLWLSQHNIERVTNLFPRHKAEAEVVDNVLYIKHGPSKTNLRIPLFIEIRDSFSALDNKARESCNPMILLSKLYDIDYCYQMWESTKALANKCWDSHLTKGKKLGVLFADRSRFINHIDDLLYEENGVWKTIEFDHYGSSLDYSKARTPEHIDYENWTIGKSEKLKRQRSHVNLTLEQMRMVDSLLIDKQKSQRLYRTAACYFEHLTLAIEQKMGFKNHNRSNIKFLAHNLKFEYKDRIWMWQPQTNGYEFETCGFFKRMIAGEQCDDYATIAKEK